MVSVWFRILFLTVAAHFASLSHASAKDTTVILLFGDSIVAGYGLSSEETVPSHLQAILQEKYAGIEVINGGVSGDTTSSGRNRLEWTLDKHRPDLVVLALGGNDLLRGIPPEITKENIDVMIELLEKRGIPAVLSAVRAPYNLGGEYRARFEAIYTEAAKRSGIPLYPFLLNKTFGKNDLMQPDGIHPNAKGAKTIARDLAAYLQTLPMLKHP